jgi:hypothetical protein
MRGMVTGRAAFSIHPRLRRTLSRAIFSLTGRNGVYEDSPGDEGYDPKFAISKNPGDYDVKVLIDRHLARSIKFTVKADGSFDNGIADANKLGAKRLLCRCR